MLFFFILLLIFLNGLLAMSEIAFVSLKKTRFIRLSKMGDSRAKFILELLDHPSRFFSTTQIGMTLISISTGVLTGIGLSDPFRQVLVELRFFPEYAGTFSFLITLLFITYLSLIFGELVPKKLGLIYPEKVVLLVAEPMNKISILFYPFIKLLSTSTDFVSRLLGIQSRKAPSVSEEDVRMLISEGTKSGVFEKLEKYIVDKVFNIGDKRVDQLMKPRSRVIWIDSNSSPQAICDLILEHQYSHFPVADGELDNLKGVVRTASYLSEMVKRPGKVSLDKFIHKPLLIPENNKVLQTLEIFKRKKIHYGIVIDEYGAVVGVLTLTDILEAIVGEVPEIFEKEESQIIQRNKHSWYVDGLLPITEFKKYFKISQLNPNNEESYNTLGGFMMDTLGRLPTSGDRIIVDDYELEVVDIDRHRVDKLLVQKREKPS